MIQTSVTTTADRSSAPPARASIARLRSYAIGRSSSSGRMPWPTTMRTVERRSKYRAIGDSERVSFDSGSNPPVETTVLDRFRAVLDRDCLTSFKVGDRARHLEHAVVPPG